MGPALDTDVLQCAHVNLDTSLPRDEILRSVPVKGSKIEVCNDRLLYKLR